MPPFLDVHWRESTIAWENRLSMSQVGDGILSLGLHRINLSRGFRLGRILTWLVRQSHMDRRLNLKRSWMEMAMERDTCPSSGNGREMSLSETHRNGNLGGWSEQFSSGRIYMNWFRVHPNGGQVILSLPTSSLTLFWET